MRIQLARAYSEMGRIADAKDTMQATLEFAPNYGIVSAGRKFPYPNEADRRQLMDPLWKAGLPE